MRAKVVATPNRGVGRNGMRPARSWTGWSWQWRARATAWRRSRSIWALRNPRSESAWRRSTCRRRPKKPLRRPVSANPWSVEEVRRLIALWLDNVSVMSIAGALGRTPSSIRGKRRWLGLGARVRKELADRPIAQCRATPLPWKPTLDIKPILCRLWAPRIGKEAAAGARADAVSEVQMGVGARCSEG